MATPAQLVGALKANELSPLIGVPCSVLAPLVNYALENPSVMTSINPANEAHALAIASGFYLGTGKIPVLYLQNSGLGNIVNPLTSLNQIYRIPAFLLISWRGFDGPGTDAPEHDIMGRDTEAFLEVLHLPFAVLTEDNYSDQIRRLSGVARRDEIPVAAVVKYGFFAGHEPSVRQDVSGLSGYEAISLIKESLPQHHFLSTTGFISRMSSAVRDSPDFFMLGSMGLVSGIAAGVALAHRDTRVAVLDGDGSILMHLGLIPFIGSRQPRNLFHFILDNEAYASTQNQPTISPSVELDKVALACGYRHAFKVDSAAALKAALNSSDTAEGPVLIWVKVNSEIDERIGRVSISPEEIKKRFMKGVGHTRRPAGKERAGL